MFKVIDRICSISFYYNRGNFLHFYIILSNHKILVLFGPQSFLHWLTFLISLCLSLRSIRQGQAFQKFYELVLSWGQSFLLCLQQAHCYTIHLTCIIYHSVKLLFHSMWFKELKVWNYTPIISNQTAEKLHILSYYQFLHLLTENNNTAQFSR